MKPPQVLLLTKNWNWKRETVSKSSTETLMVRTNCKCLPSYNHPTVSIWIICLITTPRAIWTEWTSRLMSNTTMCRFSLLISSMKILVLRIWRRGTPPLRLRVRATAITVIAVLWTTPIIIHNLRPSEEIRLGGLRTWSPLMELCLTVPHNLEWERFKRLTIKQGTPKF